VRTARIASFLLGAVLLQRAEAGAALSVCVDQANPTAAMDVRVARAVAKTLGVAIKVVPFVGYGKGGDGMPPSRFAKMAQSDCELVMGFPVDVSDPNLPPDVEATAAYAGTGFVLVRRGGSHEISLGALPQGSEVGIAQLDTYAGLLYGTHPNIVMHVYPKDSMMLADLAAGQIAAGLAWQPTIESYANRHRASISLSPLPGRHMLWNLVALYVPQSQSVANLFSKGLYTLQSKGQLAALTKPYPHPAAPGAEHTSAMRPPAVHLQDAVAWNADAGQLLRVADTGPTPNAGPAAKSRHRPAPALYTEDQAAKGSLAYLQNCAMCHGPNMEGQSGGFPGPALKGADFADPSYDFHVNEIFNFVAKQMPSATPGSLPHEAYVQIMAYLLQQNGYPAGSRELVYEQAEKSRVPIRYYGK
jgi:mono/diheme cytochrome c family protein/ABC-type amino acid transport substrate-binding protein